MVPQEVLACCRRALKLTAAQLPVLLAGRTLSVTLAILPLLGADKPFFWAAVLIIFKGLLGRGRESGGGCLL